MLNSYFFALSFYKVQIINNRFKCEEKKNYCHPFERVGESKQEDSRNLESNSELGLELIEDAVPTTTRSSKPEKREAHNGHAVCSTSGEREVDA